MSSTAKLASFDEAIPDSERRVPVDLFCVQSQTRERCGDSQTLTKLGCVFQSQTCWFGWLLNWLLSHYNEGVDSHTLAKVVCSSHKIVDLF